MIISPSTDGHNEDGENTDGQNGDGQEKDTPISAAEPTITALCCHLYAVCVIMF